MTRTALVAGATGLVGSELLRQAVALRRYERILVPGRTPPRFEEGTLRFIPTDFSNLDELLSGEQVHDVFCCLGTTIRAAGSRAAFERVDYHMVVDLARAAQKAGARTFVVVSAAGASRRSPAFYSRVKAQMERAVSESGVPAVHIVRPSLLLGERAESRPAERLFQALAPLYSPLLAGPLARYRPVEASEVASVMLELAERPVTGTHVHHFPFKKE